MTTLVAAAAQGARGPDARGRARAAAERHENNDVSAYRRKKASGLGYVAGAHCTP